MISIFHKKIFLVDYLNGLVDIHNHILPGIDDGAKTDEDSLNLIKGFSEFGVTNFICTPHIMHNYYDNTPITIKKAYDRLSMDLRKHDEIAVNLDYAAEHMIDDNFENILEDNQAMPLGKDYLLIEMSYLQPSFNFDTAVDKIAKHAYFPILAHPERYVYFHNKFGKYASMKSKGILFQLNLLSLTSKSYGGEVQKVAEKMLHEGLIDFVGSDVHNIRQLSLLKEIKVTKKLLDRLYSVIERTIQSFY
ncbi:histidinol phosphatase [Muricauda oceani]|uniref:protein-tyrosine-phosphatase n=1 Tax=Flagellimonas oceani TaxID=2698672 RepID=A0A6G7J0N2_9FLAO|nr:CpsB/CapC family capsule biosynthesis tyrosine phosphatase [Allomuricauda oceani]MBW8245124.1 histidinol phosphatase [Allomuricauda oceani]QII44210.1 histidinol phosphatase [Allomuricauda oceani]